MTHELGPDLLARATSGHGGEDDGVVRQEGSETARRDDWGAAGGTAREARIDVDEGCRPHAFLLERAGKAATGGTGAPDHQPRSSGEGTGHEMMGLAGEEAASLVARVGAAEPAAVISPL